MNNLNVAEWIIVGILSFMLFLFLLLGCILLVKLIKISKKAQKVVETGQAVANKADDIADNIKDMTSVGGLAKGYVREYIGRKLFGRDGEKKVYNKRKVKTSDDDEEE